LWIINLLFNNQQKKKKKKPAAIQYPTPATESPRGAVLERKLQRKLHYAWVARQ
jgi:hypothetical protein